MCSWQDVRDLAIKRLCACGSKVLLIVSVFACALAERKNEPQKEDNVPLHEPQLLEIRKGEANNAHATVTSLMRHSSTVL